MALVRRSPSNRKNKAVAGLARRSKSEGSLAKQKVPRGWTFASIPASVMESNLGPCEKLVIGAVLYHAWGKPDSWPGVPRLSKLTSFGERKVQMAIKELEKKGVLIVEKRPGNSSVYTFIDPRTGCTTDDETPAQDAPHPRTSCTTTPASHAPEQEEGNETKERESPPSADEVSKRLLHLNVERLKSSWIGLYASVHKSGYDFTGKDIKAAERIIKSCQARTPKVDPIALIEFVMRSPHYTRGKSYLQAMTKELSVLASGLNQAVADFGKANKVQDQDDLPGRSGTNE